MDLTVQLSNPRDGLLQLAGQDISTKTAPSSQEPNGVPAPSGRRPARQPQRRLKQREVEALVAAYRGGLTMRDLARAFGVHRVTVSAHLRQHGVPIRGQGLDDKVVREAARLYEAGWSSWKLSQRFGVTPNTALAALRKAGVPIRPRRGGPPARRSA